LLKGKIVILLALAHTASYQIGPEGSYPRDKAAGAWSWPPTSI